MNNKKYVYHFDIARKHCNLNFTTFLSRYFSFLFILYLLSLFTLLFIDRLLEKEKVVIEEVKDEALNCAKERERVLQTKLDQLHTETTQKGDLHFY